ncbi:MAG: acetyl-CoA acetyltransferase [Pseudomonadota bacterium]
MDAERTPVIAGVGQINDRPDDLERSLGPVGLMEAALRRADADAGGGWLASLDAIATVDQITEPGLTEIPARLADAFGAAPARLETTAMPHGDSPVRLLNEAAGRVAAGESRITAIVGGEALRSSAQLARRAATAGAPPPDLMRANPKRKLSDLRREYGLVAPVDLYPLYENALRAAEGLSLAEAQSETATIWAGLAAVARDNPHAWLRDGTSAVEILESSARNRPISFPYTKLMVANSSVNQGAGFIVTSLAEARRRGRRDEELAFVGQGAGAEEVYDPLARDRYDRSPSMIAALRATLRFNGLEAEAFDAVELYSCFPCVPKMARRTIGLPAERPMTVFGGLTFGGGPVANYMSHAIACMTERLRGGDGRGLLYANGGIVTTNHGIVLSGAPLPGADSPRDPDVQAEADAVREPAPATDLDHLGPARIETYAVHYDREGAPRGGAVLARTPAGARTIAHVPATDAELVAFLTDGRSEPVGAPGRVIEADGRRVFDAA